MNRCLATALCTLAGLLACAGASFACEGGKTLMEDKFTKLNPAWGFSLDTNTEKIDGNGYFADFPPNSYRRGLSQLSYYTDYVACATWTVNYVCTSSSSCEGSPQAGLIVLAADDKNFYTFDIAPAYGSFDLTRQQNGKWLYPIGWTLLPSGKKFTSGERFELSAVVKGSHVTFKLNGDTVTEFDAVAPEGGSLVGFQLTTSSMDTKNSQLSLSSYEVRELPPQ